jgi:hypothetical protein
VWVASGLACAQARARLQGVRKHMLGARRKTGVGGAGVGRESPTPGPYRDSETSEVATLVVRLSQPKGAEGQQPTMRCTQKRTAPCCATQSGRSCRGEKPRHPAQDPGREPEDPRVEPTAHDDALPPGARSRGGSDSPRPKGRRRWSATGRSWRAKRNDPVKGASTNVVGKQETGYRLLVERFGRRRAGCGVAGRSRMPQS